ncbi:2,3-bisphosphoglycerate-independent phosphoglycerate mutase [Mycoplasmopsis lipofaciens]|uniref:2,3-bisphosphoglycerate-independent phosphoglycerate mutase n=1 Tax=Mycoplasmopsis lipofaciens TaxID=114884 RepID=UPI0004881344|nr:2,3-bisphosphoglycerate-independent phosphoglycerate mutase [Mycoplasmopsis lipofaciens]
MNKKVVLIVIDGLGLRDAVEGNAVKLAETPTIDNLLANYPNSVLQASGEFVGLPKGQMGNSEVGHLNIGAGTVVYTGLSLINKAMNDGTFEKNEVFNDVFNDVEKKDSTLHLMGLLSPGGVHSLEDHLFRLLDMAHAKGLKNVSVHAFGDGRDVAPKSILTSLEKLQAKCDEFGYKIASIGGRFWGMDRDKMFDRVEKHYDALLGIGDKTFTNAIDYVNQQYAEEITDEFLAPAFNPEAKMIQNNDSIIFFNFRPDRARQLTHLFIGSKLYDISPKHPIKISKFASMMKYEGIDTLIAFDEMDVPMPIGKAIEIAGKSQLHLAETQKYAHVTYFMDGGKDIEFKNSHRIMVPSLKVESYADAPKMSAEGITDELIKNALNYDLTIMNYANPDMVGHTGNLKSTIEAVSWLDKQLKRVVEFAEQNNITVFITADHGNSEVMLDKNNKPATKHTENPVFLICTDKSIKLVDGKLANVAPTILDYMGVTIPKEMDEKSVLIK